MLPSLRPLIAESMMALSIRETDPLAFNRTQAGAATLRWCDANDPDVNPCGEQSDRIYQLMQALDDVRAAVLAWDTSIGTKRHAELRDEIASILAEVGV